MPIRWLWEKFKCGRRESRARSEPSYGGRSNSEADISRNSAAMAIDDKRGSQSRPSDGEGGHDPAVVASLASFFRVINESVDIATRTKNPETFASRLQVAEDKMLQLNALADRFDVPIDGVSEATSSIEELKRRGPPSVETTPQRRKAKAAVCVSTSTPPESKVPEGLFLSPWLTRRKGDAGMQANAFWEKMRTDAKNGEFWADKAKSLKDNPDERLRLAMKNLPLPGAFSEAAVATRAIIRGLKKEGHATDRALSFLYWLAAIHSFYVPYSKRLAQPGFNVMEAAPGGLIASLPFSYTTLGLDGLALLNATGRRAMEAIWGTPQKHSTLHLMHQDVWEDLEDKIKAAKECRLERLLDQIR